MTKILVTGSEGFIGSHLVEKLSYDIIGFDIRKNPFHDITNISFVERVWAEHKPDIVVHLAANPRLDLSKKYPWWDAQLNIVGTVNALQASIENDVKLFIYASTCQIYDAKADRPMGELSPCNPKSAYAISKYTGEIYCKYFGGQGLNICVLRFFNVFGPRQSEGYVVPDLLERTFAAHDGRVKVLGPPDDSRDYIYVGDIARAIEKVIENSDRFKGEVINIGTGIETTTKQLCETISHVLHKPVEFYYGDRPPGRLSSRFQADISKANSLLGWRPQVNLEEGMRLTALSKGLLQVPAQMVYP